MKKKSGILITVLFLSTILFAQVPKGYMSLQDIATKTNSVLYWDSMSSGGMFEKDGHFLNFSVNSPLIIFDYSKTEIVPMPISYNGNVYAHEGFLSTTEDLFNALPPEVDFRIGAIIIDAGHGGRDPGAVGTHTINGKSVTQYEKDICLYVAKVLHAELSKAYPNKKILLTRDDDTFLKLEERTDIANAVQLEDNEAILNISIHVNSALNKEATGFEVWYLSPGYRRTLIGAEEAASVEGEVASIINSMLEEEFTTESILIADYIHDGIEAQVGHLSPSRGLKEEEWFVVRNAKMPSVLVELGFISNKEEATLLYDKNYLNKLTIGIYNGTTAFVTHFEESRGFTGSTR